MISRIRYYQSYDEAVQEWRRFGIPDVVPNAVELLGRVIVYLEDADRAIFDDLRLEIENLGGKAFRCDTSVTRMLIAGSPEVYWNLLGTDIGGLIYDSIVQSTSLPEPVKLSSGQLDFDSTLIMGVLNVTPDSFSDGGLFMKKEKAVERALEMADEGADIIDIGGESTRPGAEPVSPDEERNRVIPALKEIIPSLSIPISIDTVKPEIAAEAVEIGARIINDVSGLRDERMIETAKKAGAPVITMHMRGEPRTMQTGIHYDDIVGDISLHLEGRMRKAESFGLGRDKIILDPGLGFGKRLEDNLSIIRRLREFKSLGRPLLVGPSRKAFIGKILSVPEKERTTGTMAVVTVAIMNGANIVRVHDVKEAVEAAKMADSIKRFTKS